jgi:hypothetical protein
VRNDGRIINKLHRRIFLDKITHDDAKIYLSFYVEASNRCAPKSDAGAAAARPPPAACRPCSPPPAHPLGLLSLHGPLPLCA